MMDKVIVFIVVGLIIVGAISISNILMKCILILLKYISFKRANKSRILEEQKQKKKQRQLIKETYNLWGMGDFNLIRKEE